MFTYTPKYFRSKSTDVSETSIKTNKRVVSLQTKPFLKKFFTISVTDFIDSVSQDVNWNLRVERLYQDKTD